MKIPAQKGLVGPLSSTPAECAWATCSDGWAERDRLAGNSDHGDLYLARLAEAGASA